MTTATHDNRTVLTTLVGICHDGELGFAAASGALPADERLLKPELLQYSRQRREFADDLAAQLLNLGEEEPSHGTLAGTVHRGWMRLKEAVMANHRFAILTECERSEAVALSTYLEVLGSGLPPQIHNLVNMQYVAVSGVHRRIRELRDAANPEISRVIT